MSYWKKKFHVWTGKRTWCAGHWWTSCSFGLDLLPWPIDTYYTWFQWNLDRLPDSTRAVPFFVYQRSNNRIIFHLPTYLAPHLRLQAGRGLYNSASQDDLQGSFLSRRPLGADCTRVSIRRSTFLLKGISHKKTVRRCLRLVITDGSYVGFCPDCYAFCAWNGLSSVPDYSEESSQQGTGRQENTCELRKASGHRHIRRCENKR